MHLENRIPAVRGTTRTDKRPAAHATTRRGRQAPSGERDCHLRKQPLARPTAMTLSEFIMRHHAWPPHQRGKAAPGLKAVETLGIRLCRSAKPAPYCSQSTGVRVANTVEFTEEKIQVCKEKVKREFAENEK